MFARGIAKIGGQRRGTPNRLTTNFREAVLLAYENISGHEAFSKWAAENRTDFYKIAARLIPTEVKGSDDEELTIIVLVRKRPRWTRNPPWNICRYVKRAHLVRQCHGPAQHSLGTPASYLKDSFIPSVPIPSGMNERILEFPIAVGFALGSRAKPFDSLAWSKNGQIIESPQ